MYSFGFLQIYDTSYYKDRNNISLKFKLREFVILVNAKINIIYATITGHDYVYY